MIDDAPRFVVLAAPPFRLIAFHGRIPGLAPNQRLQSRPTNAPAPWLISDDGDKALRAVTGWVSFADICLGRHEFITMCPPVTWVSLKAVDVG